MCNQIKILSKGGRPKKIKRSGRPSGCASPNQLWTRQNSFNLKSTVPTNLKNLSSINPLDFDDDLVSLAVCPICNKIFCEPMLIVICQHVLCFNCLVSQMERIVFPLCICPVETSTSVVTPNVVTFSKQTTQIIDRLKLKNTYPTKIKNLSEIFSLTSNDPVPREFEKAAVHIIKTKLAQSNDRSISFNTGRSRVCCLTDL